MDEDDKELALAFYLLIRIGESTGLNMGEPFASGQFKSGLVYVLGRVQEFKTLLLNNYYADEVTRLEVLNGSKARWGDNMSPIID
jgi:hypothetical protein